MRFNIAYTDYKQQILSKYYITHKFNNEVKPSEYMYKINSFNVNRSFEVEYDNITPQNDNMNNNFTYIFELKQQHVNKRSSRIDKLIDKICSILILQVDKNKENNTTYKINAILDENKISQFHDIIVPELNITINIYDMLSIPNVIDQFTTN